MLLEEEFPNVGSSFKYISKLAANETADSGFSSTVCVPVVDAVEFGSNFSKLVPLVLSSVLVTSAAAASPCFSAFSTAAAASASPFRSASVAVLAFVELPLTACINLSD